MTTIIVLVCAALLLCGAAAVIRWGGLSLAPPERAAGPPTARDVAARTLWWLNLATTSGLVAGLLASGPGSRLVMRLLAVTAGDKAQGRITEADEVVGVVTVEGTIGLFVFGGLAFGLLGGLAYVLLQRWIPRGWLGALLFGLGLLVVVSTRADPLRRGNVDFDIVGPGWLAVLTYGVGVVMHGMLVAALAARISRALPLLDRRPAVVAAYSPLVFSALFPPILLGAVTLGVLTYVFSRWPALLAVWRAEGMQRAGQVAIAALVLITLPGFVSSVVDIFGRG